MAISNPVVGKEYQVVSGSCGSICRGSGDNVEGSIIKVLSLKSDGEINSYEKVGDMPNRKNKEEIGQRIGHSCNCLSNDNLKELNSISIMKKLSNFIKKTVSTDTQELLKAGLINGDLEPTAEGMSELTQIQWFANITALVDRAKEINAEAEAQAKK